MIRHTDLIVMILGAGASAPFGLPVMASFMNQAKRRSQTAEGEMLKSYGVMLDFWSRCRASSWALQRNWDNIEELYTQADLLRLANIEIILDERLYNGTELCKHISWCIWDVYRSFPKSFSPWPQIVSQVVLGGLNVAIITTNYDLVVEHSLNTGGSRFAPYYPGFTADCRELKTECDLEWASVAHSKDILGPDGRTYIPIVKLHGSVNWFQHDSNPQWIAASTFSNEDLEEKLKQGGCLYDREQILSHCRGQTKDDIWLSAYPAIIPPMLGKMSNSKTISTHWSSAISMLRRAREVWVMGYSFPQTDAFMLRLLTEGLYDNHDLTRFVIIDRQTSAEWKDRLDHMLEPIFRSNSFAFRSLDSQRAMLDMRRFPPREWLDKFPNNG